MNTIRVALVDDHNVVRRGLRTYLESFPDIEVVGTAESGEEAVQLVDTWMPDVIVLDMLMPGGIDGIESTRRLRSRSLNSKVLILTASTDEGRIVPALRAGAIGYVMKDADPELLLHAIRGAARGQSVIDPSIAGIVMQDMLQGNWPGHELTDREMTVLRQLAHGRTNREIAEHLFISEETVKTHVGNILTKLQLAHRTQAVIYALKRGLIALDELELPGQ